MLLSRKQTEYVRNAERRWNFKGGATRSGKTYLDFRWVIPMRIRDRIGKDGLVVILGVTKSTIERNVLEPMRNIYGDELVGSISSDNTVKLFGEKCYALGAEKVSQVSKIRGVSIKYCYGDEVADWSNEVFELLKSRLDKEYSCFDGTFNPQYPQHWLKQFLDSDADIYSQTYTIDDNPFLPAEFVENLKKEYAGTVFYERYILGLWVSAEGLVYPYFANNTGEFLIDNPIEWAREHKKRFYKIMIGVDFGGTKSHTAFKAVGITYDWYVVVLDEEHIDSVELDPDKLQRRFCGFVERVQAIYGRSQTRADNEQSVLIRGLQNAVKKAGLNTTVLNSIKAPINDRIKLTTMLMAQGRLKVNIKCEHMIDAFQTAIYDPDKFEDVRLDDGTSDIDSLDAFEYCIEPWYQNLIKAVERSEKSVFD